MILLLHWQEEQVLRVEHKVILCDARFVRRAARVQNMQLLQDMQSYKNRTIYDTIFLLKNTE